MRSNRGILALMSLWLAVVPVSAALASPFARPGLHHGPARPFAKGSARAFVAVDVDGAPVSMGVSLDAAASASLRRGVNHEAVLPLPRTAGLWNAATRGESPAFRVRFDAASGHTLVVLEGMPPASAPLAWHR